MTTHPQHGAAAKSLPPVGKGTEKSPTGQHPPSSKPANDIAPPPQIHRKPKYEMFPSWVLGWPDSLHEALEFPARPDSGTWFGFNWFGETPSRLAPGVKDDLSPLPYGHGKYIWAQLRDKLSTQELRVCRPMRAILMSGTPLTLIGNSRKSVCYFEYCLRQGFRVRTFILVYNSQTRSALLKALLTDDMWCQTINMLGCTVWERGTRRVVQGGLFVCTGGAVSYVIASCDGDAMS